MRCPECDKDDLEEIKIDVDGEFSFAEHFSYCPVCGKMFYIKFEEIKSAMADALLKLYDAIETHVELTQKG